MANRFAFSSFLVVSSTAAALAAGCTSNTEAPLGETSEAVVSTSIANPCKGVTFAGSCRSRAWIESNLTRSGHTFRSAYVLANGKLILEERSNINPSLQWLHLVSPARATSGQPALGGYVTKERVRAVVTTKGTWNLTFYAASGASFIEVDRTQAYASSASDSSGYYECVKAAYTTYRDCATSAGERILAGGMGVLVTAGAGLASGAFLELWEALRIGGTLATTTVGGIAGASGMTEEQCLDQLDRDLDACKDLLGGGGGGGTGPIPGDDPVDPGEFCGGPCEMTMYSWGEIETSYYDAETGTMYVDYESACTQTVSEGHYSAASGECTCQFTDTRTSVVDDSLCGR